MHVPLNVPAYVLVGAGELVHLLSKCCCPAEQHGHLLIGHAVLLSHSHGLTQVDGQDVFALREKIVDADSLHGLQHQCE